MFLKRFLTIENSMGGYRYDTKRFRRFFYYVYKSRGTYLCRNSFAFIFNKMRFIFSLAKISYKNLGRFRRYLRLVRIFVKYRRFKLSVVRFKQLGFHIRSVIFVFVMRYFFRAKIKFAFKCFLFVRLFLALCKLKHINYTKLYFLATFLFLQDFISGYSLSRFRRLHFGNGGVASSNKVVIIRNDLIGVNFVGHSFFNLYLRLFFLGKNRFYLFKRILHFYSFFYYSFMTRVEVVFLSFLMSKFIVKLMFYGDKAITEILLFSIFHSLKLFVGLSVNSLFFNSLMSLRVPLMRTFVFLAGRGHVVPTPSVFDKQFKFVLRTIILLVRKRQYVRDSFKRSLVRGHYVGRRIPLYRRGLKLSLVFIRTQSFFLSLSKKYQSSRFLKNDILGLVKKNMYMFLLQRTYIQYR
jgi:hypothetical protein